MYHYGYISLDDYYTDYNIVRTDSFEKAFQKSEGSMRQRVEKLIGKLRTSIHHPGFEWDRCRNGLWYFKINDQYRMTPGATIPHSVLN